MIQLKNVTAFYSSVFVEVFLMRALRWILFIPSGFLVGAIVGALFAAVQALMDGTASQHGYGYQWGVGAYLGVTVGAFIAPIESKLKAAAILVAIHLLLCGFSIWSNTTYDDGKRVIDYVFMAFGAICGWGQFLTAKKESDGSGNDHPPSD